jgi:hypothetical protein
MSEDDRPMPEAYSPRLLQPLVGEISRARHLVVLCNCRDSLEREFFIRMTKGK